MTSRFAYSGESAPIYHAIGRRARRGRSSAPRPPVVTGGVGDCCRHDPRGALFQWLCLRALHAVAMATTILTRLQLIGDVHGDARGDLRARDVGDDAHACGAAEQRSAPVARRRGARVIPIH